MPVILKSSSTIKSDNIDVYDDLRKAVGVFRVKSARKEYVHQFPQLPEWTNKIYRYRDEEVNLFKFTCSCTNYKIKSEKYSARDIRRACKHIYYKLIFSKANGYVDELSKLILRNVAIFNEDILYNNESKDNTFYIGYKSNNQWVNIYVNSINYSYNIIEHRWRSNLPPKEDWKYVNYINKLFKIKNDIVRLK